MSSQTMCQSCSMTIDSGAYCQYCADDRGELHPFEEHVERFMNWTLREEPGLDAASARQKTLEFMATMPAWKDNPQLVAALGG